MPDSNEHELTNNATSIIIIMQSGILIARLFGQKRVTDEHSLLNSLSVEEFFSRYPGMQEYLQAEVISAAEDQISSTEGTYLSVRPSLQPVLVILSKLGRGIQEQYDERYAPRPTKYLKYFIILKRC